MNKHTQGKWEVSSSTLIVNEEGRVLANCCSFGIESLDLPLKECIANARLIAAAPELLEACKAIIKDHEERMAMYPKLNEQPNRLAVMQMAREAIAKAE